jgi:hypothetical protein
MADDKVNACSAIGITTSDRAFEVRQLSGDLADDDHMNMAAGAVRHKDAFHVPPGITPYELGLLCIV